MQQLQKNKSTNFQAIRDQLKIRLFEEQKPRRTSILGPNQNTSLNQHHEEHKTKPESPLIQKKSGLSYENEWESHEYIGEGGHAVVKRCYQKEIHDQSPGMKNRPKQCAVKIFRTGDPEIVNTIKQTFNLNRQLYECKNIIKGYDLYIDERKQVIHWVMEYCNYKSLEYLIEQKKLIKPVIQEILEQTAICVEFMHLKGIAHRDLKPDNILVYVSALDKVELKIIDFGVSKKFLEKSRLYSSIRDMWTRTGTIFYQAPEIFEGGGYDKQVDIWSIGVILFQMLCGRLPFQCDTIMDTISMISDSTDCYEQDPTFQKLNHLEQDLLKRLLKKDPAKRLTAKELKLHPWLSTSQSSSPALQNKCRDDSSVFHNKRTSSEEIIIDMTQSTFTDFLKNNHSLKKWQELQIKEEEEEQEENLISPRQREQFDFTDHIHYVQRDPVNLKQNTGLKLNKIMSDQISGTSQELSNSSPSRNNSLPFNSSPQQNTSALIQLLLCDGATLTNSIEFSPCSNAKQPNNQEL